MPNPANIHGRKPGRGLRPFLLIPKVIVVALAYGGIAAAAVIAWAGRPATAAARQQFVDTLGRLFTWLIIPAMIAAILLGLALLMPHLHVLIRQRWLQVKLALALVGIPVLHLLGRATMLRLRAAAASGNVHHWSGDQRLLGVILTAAVVLLTGLIVLGRHKPRLGQNWAKAFRRIKPKVE